MSQAATILRLLTEARGEWVSAWDLHLASGALAIPTRVSDIFLGKHDGKRYNIENRVWVMPDGKKHSAYRLAAAAAASPAATPTSPPDGIRAASVPVGKPSRAAAATDLFTSTRGDTHHDY
jgi:hypothetical protein